MRAQNALTLAAVVALSGCGTLGLLKPKPAPAPAPAPAAVAPAPIAPTPIAPTGAKTAEALDTTTAAERTAATAAPAPAAEALLGKSVASLGDPTSAGFWVSTALVKTETPGRIVNPATKASVKVTLKPGPAGGAKVSLAAFRLLGVPLTALPEVELYAGG